MPRSFCLEAFRCNERDHQVVRYKASATACVRRFTGADGKVLVKQAQMSRVGEQDLFLGTYDGTSLHSRKADKQRLVLMLAALGRKMDQLDQCEDTVRYSDTKANARLP